MAAEAVEFPGPAALGRGAVVGVGAASPPALAAAPRYVVDDDVLASPGPLAQVLHHHWVRREPFVVELAVEPAALARREVVERPPWELGPWFGLERERLAHRVWANGYDLRGAHPVWWRGELAARHAGCTRATSGGDVVLPDGRTAWVDGGPRGPVAGLDDTPVVHRESVDLLRRATVTGEGHGGRGGDELLADDQRAAVDHRAGPARVLAPAGSGKTRVLAARLRHLLDERAVEPELVTAVAYNRRAAAELTGRVARAGAERMPGARGGARAGAERMPGARGAARAGADVRTIHSLAYAICRDGGMTRLLDERDVRRVLEDLVSTPRIPNTDPLQPWLEALGEVRLGLRDPATVEAERGDVDGLVDVLPQFRAELARRDAVDFDEQLVRAIELLCTDPVLRDRWRARCTHLLVDEFQDLTPAFLLLLRLLAWPDLQVFGVGDDDQVIYSYAGADPAWLLDFDLGFPGAADHRLEVNYRCPPAVVDGAVALLSHNRRRVAKAIRASEDHGADGAPAGGTPRPALDVVHVAAEHEVAARVVALVGDRLAGGAAPAEVAVLARVNAALLPAQVLLGEAGVPTTAPLDRSILQRTGVRAALAYLRIGVQPDAVARGDLFETVNRPARKLRSAVSPFLQQRGRWSLAALRGVADSLNDTGAERLEGWCDDLDGLADRARAGADTAALLAHVRDEVGLGEAMATLDAATSRPEGSGHGDDLTALLSLAPHHPDPTTFARWLAEVLARPADEDGVVLSTVHRVKGMEWDHVVVAPASDGQFPHRLADSDAATEEERRVFHVAVTRGRRSVAVVAPRTGASPFVAELATARPDAAADAVGVLAAHAARPVPDPPDTAPVTDGEVAAVAGLRVTTPGGVTAVVDELRDGAALARALGADGTPTGVRLRLLLAGSGEGPPTTVAVDGTRAVLRRPARRTTRRAGTSGLLVPSGGDRATDPTRVSAIFERLRTWRTEQATSRGVPAYVVFSDATLTAIAERQPGDERQLLAVKGIGEAKLEQYADDVLAIVADTTG